MTTTIPDPILVTGCARSGTSLTAGIIHLCGAWGGSMVGPNPFNKKGMFENRGFKRRALKAFLKEMGVDPLGQKPLPDIQKVMDCARRGEGAVFRKRVVAELRGQGYMGGPWFWKGAKLCLIWPIVHDAFPSAKWVIVRRRAEDIADSCLRTSFMRAYDTAEGWLGWVEEHKLRFREMQNRGLRMMEVWPLELVSGSPARMKSVMTWLGLQWNDNAVGSFVDGSMFHHS